MLIFDLGMANVEFFLNKPNFISKLIYFFYHLIDKTSPYNEYFFSLV